MQSKSLLIPIAAFAVTAAGFGGFSSQVYARAGLTAQQKDAFESARELKLEGNYQGARAKLEEAGINLDTLESLRKATHEKRDEMRSALHDAVEAVDYAAFKKAAAESPLGDIITTEADFKQFVEAHNLRKEGLYEEAKTLFEELGIEKQNHGRHAAQHFGEFENYKSDVI